MAAPVIIIMGPQGSGKGTQAGILCARLGLAHLSSGALLRATKNQKILDRIGSGQLALSEDVQRVMKDAIEALPDDQGALIDAFPRMIGEAHWLSDFLNSIDRRIDKVVLLVLPHEESLKRLLSRAEKEGRQDDTREAIEKRLAWTEKETSQSLAYWKNQGLLAEVDGVGTVEEIAERIKEAIGR